MFPCTVGVDLFPFCMDIHCIVSTHVETVVLLSKGEVDSKKIRVEFSLEDMDMSEFQDGATYPQIKEYVLEHTGLKVSNSNTGVLAGTGCTVLVSYLIGLIPKAKEYLPTLLMDGNSLIYGTVEARSYVTAIYITVLLSVVCLAISFPVFNKKYL